MKLSLFHWYPGSGVVLDCIDSSSLPSFLHQLNKVNSLDVEAPFSDLDLFLTNGRVPSKMCDKQDAFNFEIVNFPFLD